MDIKLATKLLSLVLANHKDNVRKVLHKELTKLSHSEPQFCNAISENVESFKLTNEQWFDLLLKIPNRILLENRKILLKLTPEQRERLRVDL